ncbi:MAG: prepilin-type N-terminal cleavage/methylation domain-containing protein [bacterium]
MRDKDLKRGFTLLELMLVLALIGLLTTLVLPRLDVLTGAELDTASRRISNRVRYLREEAARRGIWIRLVALPEEKLLLTQEGVETPEGWAFVEGEGPLYRPLKLPDSLTLHLGGPGARPTADGRLGVLFAADGFADPTVVQIADDSGRIVSILIEPARTRPRVIDGAVAGMR